MYIFVINSGSSSIKYQLWDFPSGKIKLKGLAERIGSPDGKISQKGEQTWEIKGKFENHKSTLELILNNLWDKETGVMNSPDEIGAVGHRVVHGGEKFTDSVEVDEDVIKKIEEMCAIAPLHNPPNLEGIKAIKNILPKVPNVAFFDTAFHQTMEPHSYRYAINESFYAESGIRKYGFHGTSHQYLMIKASELLDIPTNEFNGVTCHLGNGSSLCSIKNGCSIDTSMGFTPLQGLMMGTRSGDIDPGVLFHLLRNNPQLTIDKLDDLLNKKSGILSIYEKSNDMRDVEENMDTDPKAMLAFRMFCHRITVYLGGYLALLPEVHAIIFSGGIGENSPLVREEVMKNFAKFGIQIDSVKNRELKRGETGNIASESSEVAVLVIPTDEEGKIARDTWDIVYSK
ncbi:MAG: acetate kinase [Deltaproteobacteria bacterium]|nr:acetate kinase [Deltaproteobacteria bacterium]